MGIPTTTYLKGKRKLKKPMMKNYERRDDERQKKNIKRIILLVLTLSRRKTKFLWQNGSFLLYFSKLKKKEIKRAKIAKKTNLVKMQLKTPVPNKKRNKKRN